MSKKIFVFGSLNQDFVIAAPRAPEEGETVAGGGFFTNFGGKGANQAAACGKSGADVYMIGCVGKDACGVGQIKNLESFHVRTDFVRQAEGVPTGAAVILLTGGNNRIVIDGGANGAVAFQDVKTALDQKAAAGDLFVCQLEVPLGVVEDALVYAKSKGLTTVLNPAPATALSERALSAADIVIPNESEAALLTGVEPSGAESVGRAAEAFFAKGVKTVIITLGARGAAVIGAAGAMEIVPSFRVKAVDTTAAGDTFIGALAAALAGGEILSAAVRYANAAAALSVTVKGAQCSIPVRADVLNFLETGRT
jgi:ribokinase